MELVIAPGDHLDGDRVHLNLLRVVGLTAEHLMVEGMQKPTPCTPWRLRRIYLRQCSIKKCMVVTVV